VNQTNPVSLFRSTRSRQHQDLIIVVYSQNTNKLPPSAVSAAQSRIGLPISQRCPARTFPRFTLKTFHYHISRGAGSIVIHLGLSRWYYIRQIDFGQANQTALRSRLPLELPLRSWSNVRLITSQPVVAPPAAATLRTDRSSSFASCFEAPPD
jgi:hypothetical protein